MTRETTDGDALVYHGRVQRAQIGIVACLASACFFLWAMAGVGRAHAGIEDWQLNEVVTRVDGTQIRYVELYNEVGGCLFASTRIIVYDAQGAMLAATTLVPATTCYGPDSYFLSTTPLGALALGVGADHQGLPELPVDSGQVCFSSTSTRYDCTRWGVIATPVTDLFGTQDGSAALAPGDGEALERTDITHVVMDDWQLDMPTPRGPNDGSPWTPPDAGPSPPDAGATPDAGPGPRDGGGPMMADAAVGGVDAAPDARSTRYLDLDPAGGACGCQTGARRGSYVGPLVLAALFSMLLALARRGRGRGKESGWPMDRDVGV